MNSTGKLYASFIFPLVLVALLPGCSGNRGSADIVPLLQSQTRTQESAERAAAIGVSPSSIELNAVGESQTVAVSESGFSGTFTATSSNPSIATVAATAQSGAWIITAAGPGSASITFSDSNRHSVKVAVKVSLVVLTLEQYISPATQSVSVTQDGSPLDVVPLSPATSPNCTGSPLECVIYLPGSAGEHTFGIALYDGPTGSGNLLSLGTAKANVSLTGAKAKEALSGIVSSLKISLSNPNPTAGTPATSDINVLALDADGQTIAGNRDFVDASGTAEKIVIADSDTTHVTKISGASLAKPDAKPPVLSYDGGHAAAPLTISASLAGVPEAATAFIPATPPSGLATTVTSSSIEVTWDPVPGATGYAIFLNGAQVASTINQTSVTLPGLSGATTYAVTVSATFGNETGPQAPPTSATTGTTTIFATVCAGPCGIDVISSNNTASPEYTINTPNSRDTVAVNSAGTIYGNSGQGFVTEYPFGSTSPSTTITSGLMNQTCTFAEGITVDSAGNLYVDQYNCSANSASVTEYAAGSTSPGRVLPASGSGGVAVDSAGTVYVANFGFPGNVTVYPAGQTTPSATLTNGLSGGPIDVAVDPSGDVYVLTVRDNLVTEFPPGATSSTQPIAVINAGNGFSQDSDEANEVFGLAVDAYGAVYVANYQWYSNGEGSIAEYVPGASAPSVVIPEEFVNSIAVLPDAASDPRLAMRRREKLRTSAHAVR